MAPGNGDGGDDTVDFTYNGGVSAAPRAVVEMS